MNNPFINLRKFVPDRADPKENHATESLAACLQFSPVLRTEFVRFLFGDTPLPFNNTDCNDLEVSSQVNVGKFGILDLYLSIRDKVHIVIEVKVAAPENKRQLRDYRNWLKTQNGDQKFLFSLVSFQAGLSDTATMVFFIGEVGEICIRHFSDLPSGRIPLNRISFGCSLNIWRISRL